MYVLKIKIANSRPSCSSLASWST